jgi:hypothetical protein
MLCVGLALFFGAIWSSNLSAAPVLSQATLNADSAGVTVGSFDGGGNTLVNVANLSDTTAAPREYVSQTFIPSVSGTYVFGLSKSNEDTVLVLYDTSFDPSNPATNALIVNDDSDGAGAGGVVMVKCGARVTFCPKISTTLQGGNTYQIVITSYSPAQTVSDGVDFYVFGEPVLIGATAPTLKADVVAGLLSKELIAYQFYKGSIQSVNDRLAWLATRRGNSNKSRQGIKFKFGDPVLNQLLNSSPKRFRDYSETDLATLASRLGSNPELYEDILKAQALSLGIAELEAKTGDVDLNPEFESTSNSWSVWSDGEISVGKNSASTIASSRDFNRTVITIGLDKEYEQDNLIGFALSAGREDADVGTGGSTIQSDNVGAILYTTYTSERLPQIEASLGYGDLTFETKRIDGSETLTGERKGSIYYGSVGFRRSNTPQEEEMSYSTHARLNLGQITLKSYSETGGVAALTYSDQDIDYEELEAGVEMSKVTKWRSFTLRPHTTLQYSHFLNKSSPASMRYTSSSTIHTSVVQTEMQSGWSISAGVDLWGEGNLSSNLALSRSQSNADNYINSITFGLRYRF